MCQKRIEGSNPSVSAIARMEYWCAGPAARDPAVPIHRPFRPRPRQPRDLPLAWANALRRLLWSSMLGLAAAAPVHATDLSEVSCPSATEDPPPAPIGTVMRRPRDYVRFWPESWICEPRMEAVANLWLAQVKEETDARTGGTHYTVEPQSPPAPSPLPRWYARLTWKLRLDARPDDASPAILFVKAEYEQPSLARFDTFVSLTAKGVAGRSSRVLDEDASQACLRVRNDCRHTEEIVLEIPRDALRSGMRTGLIIDLLGHGRTERLAIGKEILWAFGQRARLR